MKKVVNGIPTEYHFKYKLGRTGISGIFKRDKKQKEAIAPVLRAIKEMEAYRALLNYDAIHQLRAVRSACHRWISPPGDVDMFEIRSEEPEVKELLSAVSARIRDVATHLLRSTERETWTSAKRTIGSRHSTATRSQSITMRGEASNPEDSEITVVFLPGL